jgi:hypothetical protein
MKRSPRESEKALQTGMLKATTGIEPVQRSPRKSRKTPANRGRSVRPAATLPHQERAR